MKNCHAPENQTTRRILLIACATALAVAFTIALPLGSLHKGCRRTGRWIEQKGGMRAVGILALIALFPGVGLTAFHDLIMVTVRTKNWYESHRMPLQHSLSEESISMARMPERVQI